MADKTLLRKNIISTEIFFLIVYAIIILTGGDLSMLLMPVLVNVVFIIIIFANANKNAQHVEIKEQKFFDDTNHRMENGPQQEDSEVGLNTVVFEHGGTHDSSVNQESIMTQSQSPEYVGGSRDNVQKIEISGISEVQNTSFALTVEGRVYGYLGVTMSTFDVPAGMHQVQILTNDVQRKVIFDKNVMFNTKKKFIVRKKIGGYSVIIQ